MKFKWDRKYFYWGVTVFSVVVVSILVFVSVYNFDTTMKMVNKISAILTPFIIGLVFAYVLSPISNYFEVKIYKPILIKCKAKHVKHPSRVLAIISAMLCAVLLIMFLFSLIIPQIVQSILSIVNNFQVYYNNFSEWLAEFLADMPGVQAFLSEEFKDIGSTVNTWAKETLLPQANNIIQGVTSGVLDVFNVVKDIFVGIIVAIYVLFSKERFAAQIKKILYALFSVSAANKSIEITRRSHKIFSGFIYGKIIDSAIIGVLCFIGMSIFKMPFALLISTVIGITNIIPFFGPFIGAIPCAFLILLVDPLTCLYFIIFILALQQLDGNVIGPKILGDSTGLSPLWVIFGILVGGGLFGFIGMIIGVPAFAVIYSLIADFVNSRLVKRSLPTATGRYYELERLEPHDTVPKHDAEIDNAPESAAKDDVKK